LKPGSDTRCGICEYLYPSAEVHRVSLAYPRADLSRFCRQLRAIQRENMKLICPSEGKPELYDLTNDPTESRNLVEDKPDVTRELASTLDTWVRSFEHYVPKPMPRNTQQQIPSEERMKTMRGLGYAH
jgi:arylsulfatase A-like enzyme